MIKSNTYRQILITATLVFISSILFIASANVAAAFTLTKTHQVFIGGEATRVYANMTMPGTASPGQSITINASLSSDDWAQPSSASVGYSISGHGSNGSVVSVSNVNLQILRSGSVTINAPMTPGDYTVTILSAVAGYSSSPAPTATLRVTAPTVNGFCGTANGRNFYSNPTVASRCSSGTPVNFAGDYGGWTWRCDGSGPGHTDSPTCSANRSYDGTCVASLDSCYYGWPFNTVVNAGLAGDTVTQHRWGCNGINGGTNTDSTACTLAKTAPSGSISASPCTIPAGGTSCISSVSWSSADFSGARSVRQGGTQFSTAVSSGGTSRSVNPSNNSFSLVDTGSTFVRTTSAVVSCDGGSSWNGSSCAVPSCSLDCYRSDLLEGPWAPDTHNFCVAAGGGTSGCMIWGGYYSEETRTHTNVATMPPGYSMCGSCTVVPPPAYSLAVNSSGASGVAITASNATYNGTTNYTRSNITSGTSITLTAPATASGNNFSSWSGCASTSGNNCTVFMTANRSVTVNYVAPATTYPVTYNAGLATSGAVPLSQIKTQGVTLTLRSNTGNLARTGGYTYAGWNTASDGSGTNYNAGGSYTANSAVTLYPRWTLGAVPPSQPPAPTVTASATCSSGQINVSWSAVAGATGYDLQYKLSSGSTWTLLTNVTSVRQVTGLTAGVSYDFQLRAKNGVGDSTWSAFGTTNAPSACVTYSLTVNSNAVSVPITANDATYNGTTDYTRSNINSGTNITLTAPPTAGISEFTSWSGCSPTGNNICTVPMNMNRTITANYALPLPSIMNISAEDEFIRSGETTNIDWRVNTSYDMDCNVRGSGIDVDFKSNTSHPSDTIGTRPTSVLRSTSEYTLSCTAPAGEIFSDGSTVVERKVTVEVIPNYQEI